MSHSGVIGRRAGANLAVENLVERGHFVGKENVSNHIDGKLNKRAIFAHPMLLRALIVPMVGQICELSPTALAGQERSAARIAVEIGSWLKLPVITLQKSTQKPRDIAHIDTKRTVLIEDNLITGRNLLLAVQTLEATDILPIGVKSLFDSNGSLGAMDGTTIPIEATYDLGIQSWPTDTCELCDVYGADTVGMTVQELRAYEH